LLAPHRKLTNSNKIQVKNFGNAGIKVTQMIGSLPFLKYLMNEISRLKGKYSNEDVLDNRQF